MYSDQEAIGVRWFKVVITDIAETEREKIFTNASRPVRFQHHLVLCFDWLGEHTAEYVRQSGLRCHAVAAYALKKTHVSSLSRKTRRESRSRQNIRSWRTTKLGKELKLERCDVRGGKIEQDETSRSLFP